MIDKKGQEEKTEMSIDNNPDKKFDISKIKKKVRENPWIIATVVLGVIVLVLLIVMLSGGITGNVISENKAGEKVVDYVNTEILQGRGRVSLDSVSEMSGLYEVIVDFQGKKIPVYVTKDGEYFIESPALMTGGVIQQPQQPADVPKSDKPKAELFVMTHCPYGTQAEKGIIPVLELLKNKIDGGIKFVHYFMHAPEETETPIQVCIREEQSDKFLDYLICFLEEGNSDKCLAESKIDKSKLAVCVQTKADSYYTADSELSKEYGVGGSPTLVINGQIVSSGRDSASYLSVICSAFNDAPEECNEELSSSNPSPGFGYAEGSDTQAQC